MQPAAAPVRPPLVRAHELAVEAEELHDEGRWREAAQRLEAAAEQYVRATLSTTDVQSLQSLRLLALAHSQRAHELKCRITLRDAHQEAVPASTSAPAPAQRARGENAGFVDADNREDANIGGDSASKSSVGSTSAAAVSANAATYAALSNLGSHLLSTLEALHFGAEELATAELLLPPQSSASSRISLGGGLLSDSYCVVPALAASSGARSSELLTTTPPAVSPGGANARASDGTSSTALRAQVSALLAEKAALKQRCAEIQAALAKVQRRGAEQLRLTKKALAIVREVHAGPSCSDRTSAAESEIRSLRAQLEAALDGQKQQAELVRKYEKTWQTLKASARRKQQLKAAQAALDANERPSFGSTRQPSPGASASRTLTPPNTNNPHAMQHNGSTMGQLSAQSAALNTSPHLAMHAAAQGGSHSQAFLAGSKGLQPRSGPVALSLPWTMPTGTGQSPSQQPPHHVLGAPAQQRRTHFGGLTESFDEG